MSDHSVDELNLKATRLFSVRLGLLELVPAC